MTTEPAAREAIQEKTLTTEDRLAQLAQRVNQAHHEVPNALRRGLICAYEAGQALLEAYQICPNRKWLAWLAANFQFSRATAARYMRFATECNRLGLNVSMLSKIPPNEASAALKKLTVLPSGKKKAKPKNDGQPVLPAANVAKKEDQKSQAVAAAAAMDAEWRPAAVEQVAGNPFQRSVQLFQELMAGLEAVVRGDNCHDGPMAELLLLDIKPVYAELLDYLDDRR